MILVHLMVEYGGLSQVRLTEISGKDNPGMIPILDNMGQSEIGGQEKSDEQRRIFNVFLTFKAKDNWLGAHLCRAH